MTLVEFINKWNGKYMDFDGFPKDNPYQCKDVFSYWNQNFGYPYIYGDAKNMLKTGVQSGNYVLVAQPQNGDVAVWNIGEFGHIAIFVDGQYFSQNYPTRTPAHITKIPATNLIGFMRPKALIGDHMTEDERKLLNALNDNIQLLNKIVGDNKLGTIRQDVEGEFAKVYKQISDMQVGNCDCNVTCKIEKV